MSNIYITEPNTQGKVLFHTSFGDIDIELWPQQAPKACRNFVQLCLEGYYDDTIFHRVISKFMVQGGDPTGTGTGGESIYGAPFADEFHSRLRFNHRGLLAMANENKMNSNHSQFFFTLDACEFLAKKHTIFGKITGNTIFNLLPIGDIETDANDRPLDPPRLISTEVLWNPFDDIVPRENKRKREEKPTSQAEKELIKRKKNRKATKDLNLLSFGDEAEDFEDAPVKKKISSSHDLIGEKKLSSKVDENLERRIAQVAAARDPEKTKDHLKGKISNIGQDASRTTDKPDFAETMKAKIRAQKAQLQNDPREALSHDTAVELPKKKDVVLKDEAKKQQEEYAALREKIRNSRKATPVITGHKAEEQQKAKAFHEMLTPLQQQRQKYMKQKRHYGDRQKTTLEKLEKFKSSVTLAKSTTSNKPAKEAESYHGQVEKGKSDEEGEHDEAWMASQLKFKKHIDDQYRAGEFVPGTEDYVLIDTKRGHDQK